MQLNFDARSVKPNTSLEPVPSDTYIVMITAATEKPVKDKPHCSFLELEETIQDGPYKGRKVFDRLNLKNDNPKAVEIAYATLSAICHVANRLQIQHSTQLVGAGPFKAIVLKTPRNNTPPHTPQDQIQYNNEIRGYKDVNGNDPGFSGGGQGGGAPQWAGTGGQAGGGQQAQQHPPQVAGVAAGGQPAWAGATGGQPNNGQQQPPQGSAPPAWQNNNGQQQPQPEQVHQQVSEQTGENQPAGQQQPQQQGDTRPPWARQ